MQKPLILASKSPRRAAILKQIGIKFIVKGSNFKEEKSVSYPTITKVKKLLCKNAEGKASVVARNIEEGIILGADTMVLYQDHILGKPKNEKDALAMLVTLNGKTHFICSAIAIIKKTKNHSHMLSDCDVTKVHMRKATRAELVQYVATKEPLDKAGAYGIQELGAILVSGIEGDYFSIVGLPIYLLIKLSKKLHINYWEK